jgi:hypothetical protein
MNVIFKERLKNSSADLELPVREWLHEEHQLVIKSIL